LNIEQQISQYLADENLVSAKNIVDTLDSNDITDIKTLMLCAMVYRGLNDYKKATEYLSIAAKIEPNNKTLILTYCGDLIKLGGLDEAEQLLKKLIIKFPKDPYIPFQLSKIFYFKKDYRSASKNLVNLIKKHPQFAAAHMELAHALLIEGKWRAGWDQYEWRYQQASTKNMFPKFKMPHWDGFNNLDHILLIADQGYGDCFQFSRYIPLVAEKCKKVTLMRSEPLGRILDSVPGVSVGISKWENTPLTSAYCTLSGLPRLFETRPESIPNCSNLLKPSEESIKTWKKRIQTTKNKNKLKVGLTWSGRVEFENNYLRALSFKNLENLLEIENIEFYSLQVGAPSKEIADKNIIDLSKELTDFSETAAAMEALDLIITTDTSVAHLAGTLGKPTWILLNYSPDWRWGSEGSQSAWYPSARLIRQDKDRDWDSVINQCSTMLKEITRAKSPKNSQLLLELTQKNS